jgi:ABC-type polysaccharide/polyol phosphate export permease
VLAVVVLLAGVPPYATLVFVPLLIAIQVLLALGFAYLLAALAVFFRDVLHILGIGLTLWYFLTPIIYAIQNFAGSSAYFLLHLNPMTPLIVGYQRAILDGVPPEGAWLLYSTVVAVVVFLVGLAVYRRTSGAFEEEL